MVDQFLEIWFQNLDSWLMLYRQMPDDEHRLAFILATREMLLGFLDAIEAIEIDALNNLPEETKESE